MERNSLILSALLDTLGFEIANQSRIPKMLENVEFQSGTAVYDAIVAGTNIILQLNTELLKLGTVIAEIF